MCLSPWQLYEPDPSRKYDPDAGAPGDFKQLNALGCEALGALNRGLRVNKRNVWLAHLKVHLNEMGCVCSPEDKNNNNSSSSNNNNNNNNNKTAGARQQPVQ